MPESLSPNLNLVSEFHSRPLDTSVAYVLLWLVSCSDTADFQNNLALRKHLATLSLQQQTLQELVNLAQQQQDQDIIQVFDLLNKELGAEEKQFLLQMAIAVATHTNKLTACANHVLRFLADFLSLGQERLAELFFEVTGKDGLSEPADLSSTIWWTASERQHWKGIEDSKIFERHEALAILGLEIDATSEEIKRSYRRLVQLYHPDRHDQQASEAAEEKFIAVQKAYEVLKQ